jgi:hypothetical protein
MIVDRQLRSIPCPRTANRFAVLSITASGNRGIGAAFRIAESKARSDRGIYESFCGPMERRKRE